MAWPLSPLQSFVSGTPPFIEAATLNSVQDAIIRIVGGTYSLKSLLIDGTGGAIVAPPAGSAMVSALLSGATAPTPSFAAGTLGIGNVVGGWAILNSVGALVRGYNVLSSGRTPGEPTGDFTVVFDRSPAYPADAAVFATIISNLVPHTVGVLASSSGGKQAARILIHNLAGNKADVQVAVCFFAE